jgi:hypothetical protein
MGNGLMFSLNAHMWSEELEAARLPRGHRQFAWWAADDPMPAVLGCVRSVAFGGRQILRQRLGHYRVSN